MLPALGLSPRELLMIRDIGSSLSAVNRNEASFLRSADTGTVAECCCADSLKQLV
jgi:hypothetical protein